MENKNELYLEISGRAQGKTTRLKEAAKQYLLDYPDSTISIISTNYKQSQSLKNEIIKDGINPDRILFLNTDSHRGIKIDKKFYDDFDSNPYLKNIDTNGYYCTSLSKERNPEAIQPDDLLFKLLEINEGIFYSYNHSNLPSS